MVNADSAGIYVHIPFCRKACNYCNFHFSTRLQDAASMWEAIFTETRMRTPYLEGRRVASLYFGGGTPSLLGTDEVAHYIELVNTLSGLEADAEITLEANPEDLSMQKLKALRNAGINRLSMGVQSFSDARLHWMHRGHTAAQSLRAIRDAQDCGLENISADLIFGLPGSVIKEWEETLRTILPLDIPHLSCYALTVEAGTSLQRAILRDPAQAPEEEETAAQFALAMDMLPAAGYEHYEISSYAKPNCYAIHNSAYWSGKWYLGLGPSAHSFNGISRQWNIADNAAYMEHITTGKPAFEREILSVEQRMNERIMTALRTQWGLDLRAFEREFGALHGEALHSASARPLQEGLLEERDGKLLLSRRGKFFADGVISALFFV